MEEYEINGLRDKLDNLEFRLNGLSADIEELTRRLDESGRRDRDFQRAMWIQTRCWATLPALDGHLAADME